jgi:hypothetical protein
MRKIKLRYFLISALLIGSTVREVQAQQSLNATFGNASSSGGSVSY